jgi:predicted heme/steroid binding protein
LLLACFTGLGFAQVTLSIQSGSSAPGATVNLNIPITTTGTLAASVQWTMSYSVADVSAVNVTAGAAATAAGKSVACSPTGAGVLNCIAFGVNTTGISNGVLAVAAVTISASTTSTLTNISLTGAIAASGDNPPVALVASPASPNVVNGVISISQPSLSAVTITTSPSGLQVLVDGSSYTAPQMFQWTPGSTHTIGIASPQGTGSTRYVYASWSDGGAQSHSITTPGSAVTYTASFTTQYQLTTSANPSSAGTVSPASGNFYNAGATVQVTATPNSGQQFTGWSGDASGTTNPTTVSMTAPRSVVANFTSASQNITVTTNPSGLQITVDGTTYTAPQTFQWAPGSSHTIATTSPQGSGSTRYVYASWSDGGAQSHSVTAPSSAATYTANFTTQYQLTTSANPSNAGTVTPASGSFYNAGTSVQVTATPNSGQQFTGWSGDATGTTNPVMVSMTAPRNVVASFTAASQGITVTTNPSGLQITVDGTIYTAPQTFQWTPGSSHTIATTSPQGSGSTRYVYASWSDGGAQSHTVTAPSSAATYTANFTTQYQLTTSANPSNAGTVTPAAGSFYNAGTSVQVTATPNSGQQFTGWSGDATGTTNPVTITMSAPRNVVASFTGASQGVTITTNPSGLQITVDGTTYTAPQTFQWTPGSSHTIATTSPQGSGSTRYVFANWNNNGGQSQTITTPAIATTYTASFTTQYQLTTSANPSNAGTVSPGSGSFLNAGTAVQVTATPNSGRQFTGWSGDAAGDANPLILTMSAPRNVVANFGTSAPGTIITTIPSGLQIIVDGGVYTSPQTFSWAEGSTHTIGVASPQGGGGTRYAFQSWSDGGAPSHTVTVSASSTYTAFFKTQHKVTVSTSPAAGGTVELSPVSPDGFYDSGAIVQANATPGPGFQFQSWSGAVSQSSRLISFTVSSPLAVTANFGGLQDECGVSLSRNSFAAASEGDFNRVMVETGPGCAWNASSNSSWIVLNSGVSGVGRGTVGFLVLGNFSPSFRSGVIMVNGQSFTITQASANCGSNVLITNAVQPALPTGESTITLNVSAPVGCQWSASAPSGWLTILNGALGSGPGTVQVGVAANSSTLPRVGSVQIGGSAALLLQLGTSTPQFYRDVSPDNIFLPNISLLVLNNILSGCTDTEFCPELNATRSDIAPMLIRALFGDNFTYSQSPYFTDVPPTHPNFRFIQKMRELNITVGCTPSQFCPGDSVTRGQMAAFLIRAKLGGSGIPTQGTGIPTVYPTSPMFVDVPVTHPFFPFVQKIKQLGITFGCSVASYCPDGLTRRGEASAFITRSFLAQ